MRDRPADDSPLLCLVVADSRPAQERLIGQADVAMSRAARAGGRAGRETCEGAALIYRPERIGRRVSTVRSIWAEAIQWRSAGLAAQRRGRETSFSAHARPGSGRARHSMSADDEALRQGARGHGRTRSFAPLLPPATPFTTAPQASQSRCSRRPHGGQEEPNDVQPPAWPRHSTAVWLHCGQRSRPPRPPVQISLGFALQPLPSQRSLLSRPPPSQPCPLALPPAAAAPWRNPIHTLMASTERCESSGPDSAAHYQWKHLQPTDAALANRPAPPPAPARLNKCSEAHPNGSA